MKSIFFLLAGTVLSLASNENFVNDCFNGRCGLTVHEFQEQLGSLRNKEGRITTATWNIEGEDERTVCRHLSQIKPTVLGLQRVSRQQLSYLIEDCLYGYNVSGVETGNELSDQLMNPIIYKNDQNIFIERNHGSYKIGPQSLAWSKITIKIETGNNKRGKRQVLAGNLFTLFSGKTRARLFSRRPRRTYHKHVYFVNINLDDKSGSKATDTKKMLNYLYRNAMDRRRYLTVLFGSIGLTEHNSVLQTIKNFQRRRRRTRYPSLSKYGRYVSFFKNAVDYSRKKFMEPSASYTEKIWMNGLKPALSATIETEDTNRKPIVTVFYV